jgi:hypothetical protein
MTTAPHVPGPPQGPGVHPPFPAPPVEGRGRRIGLSLGVAAGVVVLVCGGGLAALIGLSTTGQQAINERAVAAVRGYLDAVRDGRYDRAYAQLCDRAQRQETASEFRERVSADPLTSYQLGEVDPFTMTVPVQATYADGDSADLDAVLVQDTGTGAFEVCELAE